MEINKPVAPSAALRVRDDVVRKQVGDTCLLLDLQSGAFYTLNETASLFWELIEHQATVEDIAARVEQQYDVSQEQLLKHLATFIDFFTGEQLLVSSRPKGH